MFSQNSLTHQKMEEDMDKDFDGTTLLGGGAAGTAQKYGTKYVDIDEKGSDKSSVGVSMSVINNNKKGMTFAHMSVKSSDSGISEIPTSQMTAATTLRQHSSNLVLSHQLSSSKSMAVHMNEFSPSLSNVSKQKVFVDGSGEELGPDNVEDNEEASLPLPSTTALSSEIPSSSLWPQNLSALSYNVSPNLTPRSHTVAS